MQKLAEIKQACEQYNDGLITHDELRMKIVNALCDDAFDAEASGKLSLILAEHIQ